MLDKLKQLNFTIVNSYKNYHFISLNVNNKVLLLTYGKKTFKLYTITKSKRFIISLVLKNRINNFTKLQEEVLKVYLDKSIAISIMDKAFTNIMFLKEHQFNFKIFKKNIEKKLEYKLDITLNKYNNIFISNDKYSLTINVQAFLLNKDSLMNFKIKFNDNFQLNYNSIINECQIIEKYIKDYQNLIYKMKLSFFIY